MKSGESASKPSAKAAASAVGDQAVELGARIDELREGAEALSDSVEEVAHEVGAYVREQASLRPYAALGVAAGAGFILGGGLTPRVSAALLRMGGRLLANMLLREVIRPPSEI